MDFTRIKAEVIKKYSENRIYLSKLDFWSYVDKPSHFTFKTSQTGFRYIKGNAGVEIREERVTSGKLAIVVNVEPVKLDDFILDRVEIIQDVEFKDNELVYQSGAYELKTEFNTKNPNNTKALQIFDVKCQNDKLTLKLDSGNGQYIELIRNL
jgi:hypothetical protein